MKQKTVVRRGQALVFSSGGGDLLNRETVDALLAEEREGRTVEIMAQGSLGKSKRSTIAVLLKSAAKASVTRIFTLNLKHFRAIAPHHVSGMIAAP